MRRGLTLLFVAGALTAVPGASLGGIYAPPPGDALPVWSQDGSRIAFLTSRGGAALASIADDGSDEARMFEEFTFPSLLPDRNDAALSPDWRWVAATQRDGLESALTIQRLDGSGEGTTGLATSGVRPAWSPDSRRVAFVTPDHMLVTVSVDGSDLVRLARGGFDFAWSPDGERIAFVGGRGIHVVDADGEHEKVVGRGPGLDVQPKWSPDGSKIAFVTQLRAGGSSGIGIVGSDGSGRRTYPGPGATSRDSFTWSRNGRAILYVRNVDEGIFRLELDTGRTLRLTSFGGAPALSPDGLRIAFATGGECRDRTGVHVATVTGKRVTRLTNSCRVVGTTHDDVLRGTGLADVLVGFGGHDRLFALASYMGDTLLGGDGNDVLVGDSRDDLLRGGHGADRLAGGRSSDHLVGGRGSDVLHGQRGRDSIYARDGERDVVTCGTNDGGNPERDEVWADRLDRISRDCEIVHRSR